MRSRYAFVHRQWAGLAPARLTSALSRLIRFPHPCAVWASQPTVWMSLHPELVKEASSQRGVTAQHNDLVVLMGQRLHKRPPNESCATSNDNPHTSHLLLACPKPPTEQSTEAKDKRVYPSMHRDHLGNGDRPCPCRSAQGIGTSSQHREEDRRTRDK